MTDPRRSNRQTGREYVPCPDCGDDPGEPDMHRADCPRCGTCGQIGPPWISPPFHRWPDEFDVRNAEQHLATEHTPSRF